MRIISFNPGHDGSVVILDDGRLTLSVEAEKDSNYRHSAVSMNEMFETISGLDAIPDVVCMGGWWLKDHYEFLHGSRNNSGYRGVSTEGAILDRGRFFKGRAHYFS